MTRGRRTYMTKRRLAILTLAEANPDRPGCRLCGSPAIYSRQLCRRDYEWASQHKVLQKFPAHHKEFHYVCVCAYPDEERLHIWKATQCRTCGKAVLR